MRHLLTISLCIALCADIVHAAAPAIAKPAREMKTSATDNKKFTKINPDKPAAETKLQNGSQLSEQQPVAEDSVNVLATIDAGDAVKAAIFKRAGGVTVIFDRDIDIATPFVRLAKGVGEKIKIIKMNGASGFRMPIPAGQDVRFEKTYTTIRLIGDSRKLNVFSGTDEVDADDLVNDEMQIVAQPDWVEGARIVVMADEKTNVLDFKDPDLGDRLLVFPMYGGGKIIKRRSFADFEILPSLSGVVVRKISEDVQVRAADDGLIITADKGINLSPRSDTNIRSFGSAIDGHSKGALLDLARWRGEPGETFIDTRRRILREMLRLKTSDRAYKRLDLARLYLFNNMGREALSMIQMAAKDNSAIEELPEYMPLQGLAKILSGYVNEGLQDLNNPNLNQQIIQNDKNIILWKAYANALLHNWDKALDGFSVSDRLWYGYPKRLRSAILMMAVEAAVATGNNDVANRWLSDVEPFSYYDRDAIDYMRGVLHLRAQRLDDAASIWREVSKGANGIARARASLALLDLDIRQGRLTAERAANRLEAMRFSWRGDDLETEILQRLADLHIELGNYRVALGVMLRAVQLNPASPLADVLRSRIRDLFIQVMVGKYSENLSPIDAIALYRDYEPFLPSGEQGAILLRNVAERFIALDMLGEAATVMNDLANSKLKGDERARTIMHAALLNLMDDKPDVALETLRDKPEPMPSKFAKDRDLLIARALGSLNRVQEAQAIIVNDSRPIAMALRADMAMESRQLADAAKILQGMAGQIPPVGKSVDTKQGRIIMRAALALAIAGEYEGLADLSSKWGAAISRSDEFGNAFNQLTDSKRSISLHDIEEIANNIGDKTFFQYFLEAWGWDNSQPDANLNISSNTLPGAEPSNAPSPSPPASQSNSSSNTPVTSQPRTDNQKR